MKIGGRVIWGIQMNANKANLAQNKKLCYENYNWAQFLNQTNRQKVYVTLGNVLVILQTYKALDYTTYHVGSNEIFIIK